jgi:4'-phosphopantetheinyl transferase
VVVEINVWWAHVADLAPRHTDWLDDAERERLSRLRRQEDRDRLTLGSAVLRSLIAHLEGAEPARVLLERTCLHCGRQHGPVTAPGRDWSCSVSHSGAFAVAAVASPVTTAIGVDLETRCPSDWGDLLPRVLAPGEAPPTSPADFLTLWVRKEAVLKANREGLSQALTSLTISEAGGAPHVVGNSGPFLIDLDLGSLRAAGLVDPAAGALAVGAEDPHLWWQRAAL